MKYLVIVAILILSGCSSVKTIEYGKLLEDDRISIVINKIETVVKYEDALTYSLYELSIANHTNRFICARPRMVLMSMDYYPTYNSYAVIPPFTLNRVAYIRDKVLVVDGWKVGLEGYGTVNSWLEEPCSLSDISKAISKRRRD